MEKAKDNICPRCLGDVPNSKNRGEFPGALSRVADVEICSLCGEDEALALLLTNGEESGMIPQGEWPISREDVERRMAPLDFTKEIGEIQKEYLREKGVVK